MIQLKAICKTCEGTGYSLDPNFPSLVCEECNGRGIVIFDDERWDIELTRIGHHRVTKPRKEESFSEGKKCHQ